MEQRYEGRYRRDVLAGAAGVAGGALAGCVTPIVGRTPSPRRTDGSPGETDPVSILAAGSLHLALTRGLDGVVDVPLQVEAHGSVTVARLVADGGRDPDIVSVADADLLGSLLSPAWYATFATNALVIAYNSDTEGGRRIADAGREGWYEPLLAGDATLGRTPPDQDPLGYRTLFMLDLAAEHYGVPGLREDLAARSRTYPETSLLSRLEVGAVDAAVTYRNMAVERGYDVVGLPGRIDLGDTDHADRYATTSYTLPSGETVRGGPIEYGAYLRRTRDAAADVFAAHVSGDYLTDYGFTRPDGFPEYTGDVPDAIRE